MRGPNLLKKNNNNKWDLKLTGRMQFESLTSRTLRPSVQVVNLFETVCSEAPFCCQVTVQITLEF